MRLLARGKWTCEDELLDCAGGARSGLPRGGRRPGVCRSDWHAWKGHEPVALPHIPGHELAGTVVEVGPAVRRWRPGDRVTVPFVCGCGACEYCRAGEAQVCPDQTQPGFSGPGSFAERVAIHAADVNLVALPDSVDFVTAACLACRFATAFRRSPHTARSVAVTGWRCTDAAGWGCRLS
jgi:D-arabinose 1-dehydrogenase-like Zn-dependent alcohol dehydrogenase